MADDDDVILPLDEEDEEEVVLPVGDEPESLDALADEELDEDEDEIDEFGTPDES